MVSRTTKRTFIQDTTLGVGAGTEANYFVEADKVNCSNIWFSCMVEPENADANSNGSWILYADNFQRAAITWTDANLNDETEAQLIIAWGVWGASNQTPFMCNESAGKISRNLRKDARLAIAIHQVGISAGVARVRLGLTCNVTTL